MADRPGVKKQSKGICFLLESFYPVTHGAATQIRLVGETLAKLGVRVTVITRQIDGRDRPREDLNGIQVIKVKPAVGLHRIGKYMMLAPAAAALLQERSQYDLIIVCDLKVLGMLGVVSARLLGKKCFLRAESCGEMSGQFAIQPGESRSRLSWFLIKTLVQLRNRILLKSDGYLSISAAISKEFLNAGVLPERILNITNAVDVARFVPLDDRDKRSLRKQLGLSGKRYFCFTGRLARGKGLEFLLRTWKTLVAEFDDIHLLLIGSGQGFALSCEHDLKRFVRENRIESTVTFTGNVENVEAYLQVSDYFVLPSESEGLSVSLLEALSCELASIGSSVPGIQDVLVNEKNGLLVPSGNDHEWYHAMKRLLDNDAERNRYSREGRKTVLGRFDIDRIVEQYIALLDSQV